MNYMVFDQAVQRKDEDKSKEELVEDLRQLRDSDSKLKKGIGTQNKNITERNRAEEVLRESEDKYRAFFEGSIDAILITTPDGGIEAANAEACRMFGMTEEEIIKGGRDALVDISDPRLNPALEERAKTGRFRGELNLKRKDGTIFPVEESNAIYKDRNGRVKTAMILRDISERKRAEYNLIGQAKILAAISDAIIIVDTSYHITSWNAMAEKIYGWNENEVLGKPAKDILRGEFPSREPLYEKLERGETLITESVQYTKDDRKIIISGYTVPLRDNQGRITSFAAINHDITERKRVEEALAEAKSQADFYLDLMGHDINNLNQIALGYLELADIVIKSNGKLSGDNIEFIEKPMISLRNSSKLIENVRKLQKTISEHKKIEVRPRDVVEAAYRQFSGIPNVNFSIQIPDECKVTILADELLVDVFTNIIGNAIKHNKENQDLEITIRSNSAYENNKKYCKIMIEDNGIGIIDDRKELIFNRYSSGYKNTKGSGLGLSLVKSLVKSYNGKIWVEDRIKGDHTKGSRFVIMLPTINNEQKCPYETISNTSD